MNQRGFGLRRWRGAAGRVIVEALCPLILLWLLVDASTAIAWHEFFGRDVQIYAVIARFWPDGFIPYRDLYDFKPPLVYAVLRLGFRFWGYTPEGLWHVLVGLIGVGVFALYGGLRAAGYAVAAPLASLGLLTLFLADPWQVVLPNTEILAAVFGAAMLGCAVAHQRSPRWWWAVGSGACWALAVLGKQPAIFWGLPLIAQLWLWDAPGRGWRGLRYLLGRAALAVAGFVLIVGLVVAYFAWYKAVGAFYHAVVADAAAYAGVRDVTAWLGVPGRQTSRLVVAGARLATMWPFTAALALLLVLTLARPSRPVLVVWLWLASSYVAVVIGPRSEEHYLILFFPALALAAGMAFEIPVAELFVAPGTRAACGLALAVVLYGGIWWGSYVPRRHPEAVPMETRARRIGTRIREVARPGDTLLVQDEPFDIYVYAGMPPMMRCFYPSSPSPDEPHAMQTALDRRPSFIYMWRGMKDRIERGDQTMFGTMIAESYAEQFSDAFGVLYRRK